MNFGALFAKQVDIRLTDDLRAFVCTTRYGTLHWKSLLCEIGKRPNFIPIDQNGPQPRASVPRVRRKIRRSLLAPALLVRTC